MCVCVCLCERQRERDTERECKGGFSLSQFLFLVLSLVNFLLQKELVLKLDLLQDHKERDFFLFFLFKDLKYSMIFFLVVNTAVQKKEK